MAVQETLWQVTKRRLLGVLFIVLIVSLVTLSIMIYNKVFTPIVEVKLRSNQLGNQLQVASDVKERGIIVGEVKAVKANGNFATVSLALEPEYAKKIPSNVSAQILPKTLFGEQYVDLVVPKHEDRPIQSGDVIPQDRSEGALEAQNVLGDLLPLLTAVQPAELNSTLTAIATALKGRGKELGRTLVNFDKYLKIMNPHTKRLVNDIGKLGKVALEYNNVSPDLFQSLKNLETGVKTVVQKRDDLDQLLTTGTSTSNVLSGFLSDNRSRLIDVTGQSNKIFNLLAQYSPEYSCLFQGVQILDEGASNAIYDHAIHLRVTVDNQSYSPHQDDPNDQGAYHPGNQPSTVTGYGANCFGLPNHVKKDANGVFQIPGKYRCLNDGAALTTDPCAQRRNTTTAARRPINTAVGSSAETALVNSIVSSKLGTTPNKVSATATLLAAPLLRGHQVDVK